MGNCYSNCENIQSGHRNGILRRKCTKLQIKSGKRHFTDERELPNQDKMRMLVEKETYKYLGILEIDTIKQEDMKKSRKNISGQPESYSI